MSTPTPVNSTASLSGSTGITRADLVNRILRRVDDNPYIEVGINALNNTDVTSTITVASDATKKFQQGGQIDWVDDGSLESGLITAVPNATSISVLRGYRGSSTSAHVAGAEFRYMGRWQPQVISEIIDDVLDSLWPELFEVMHVDWTISTTQTPEMWFVLPDDAERVLEVYQRTLSTPTDIRVPQAWGGPHFIDTDFLGGAHTRALQVYGTAINTPDSKEHGIYLRRMNLGSLTREQIAILLYTACGVLMETGMAGESKPDRRPVLGGISVPSEARNIFLQQAAIFLRKEQERLMEFLPRRNRVKFRGGRHYADHSYIGFHPVRPY